MEHLIPDIFNSPVVASASDIFWEEGIAKGLTARDTLVLSLPYEPASPEEVQLLKMLAACKLQPEQYHILQLRTEDKVAWHKLRENTSATKILLLGIVPAQLGVSALMVPHEVNYFNGASWMPTLSLQQLLSNNALKQHLWSNVLKTVYIP